MKKRLCLFLLLLFLCGCGEVTLEKGQVIPAEPIRIAVIDSGISSKVLNEKQIEAGKNYISPQMDTQDKTGHGTAVSAIMVGSEKRELPANAGNVILVPLVCSTEDDAGNLLTGDSKLLSQIIYEAVDEFSCQILNISAGCVENTQQLQEAVQYAEEQGVLIVASAGNDGKNLCYYPGGYDSVLCVGATNAEVTEKAAFSNYGEAVDIFAKGEDVETITMRGNSILYSGTSYATAFVSATAAKLLEENPSLTPKQLREKIIQKAKPIKDGLALQFEK